MSTLGVSSFSLHRLLGPIHLERRTDDGVLETIEVPMPREHTFEDFAVGVRDRFGIQAVDLCQIQFDSTQPDRLESLAGAMADAGVRVLTVPIDIGDLAGGDAATRADDVARMTDWFRVAQRLGASYVRVNTGNHLAANRADRRDEMIAALRSLSTTAKGLGLRLLVENHGGPSSDPEFLLGVRDDVGPDHLGILLDIGNFEPLMTVAHERMRGGTVDDTDLETEHVYSHIARLAPEAEVVHAKAYDPKSDGSPLLNVDRALRIVADSGYCGPVSVEWEGTLGDPWERTGEVVSAVRRAMPDYR